MGNSFHKRACKPPASSQTNTPTSEHTPSILGGCLQARLCHTIIPHGILWEILTKLDNPHDWINCFSTCKAWQQLDRDDTWWKHACAMWGLIGTNTTVTPAELWKQVCHTRKNTTIVPPYILLSKGLFTYPKAGSWKFLFVHEAFWARHFDIDNKISRYNHDYYCHIQAIQFTFGHVIVYINERGDMSAGPIQDPMSSVLSVGKEVFHPATFRWQVADATKQYLGCLVFRIHQVVADTTISFRFGSYGYSNEQLLVLTEEFIAEHHLQHFFTRRADFH